MRKCSNSPVAKFVRLEVEVLEKRFLMDAWSASYFGVNSRFLATVGGTVLDGTGIDIGQVEDGRPNMPTRDTEFHPDVQPVQVYSLDTTAQANTDIDPHALWVAGVMIARGTRDPGVARNANLFSSARPVDNVEETSLLAAQWLATGDDARAINNSFGIEPNNGTGDALLSRGFDWLAQKFNTLNVFTRKNSTTGGDTPGDSFNGITVGATSADAQSVFTQFATVNHATSRSTATNRTFTSIVAPGGAIEHPFLRRDGTATYTASSGTSLAAPHVTAAVALLQQYAKDRNQADAVGWTDRWSANAPFLHLSPLVMKAVLMNSADIVKDRGNGLDIGMEKSILRSDGKLWGTTNVGVMPDSSRHVTLTRPLDDQLGTGQLNVRRALNQFSSGNVTEQRGPKPIGWTARQLPQNERGDVISLGNLKAGSQFSATVTWERPVTLNDNTSWLDVNWRGNQPNVYDRGETFTAGAMSDIDIRLMRRDTVNGQVVWRDVAASISTQFNVEHIFTTVQIAGEYELRIERSAGPLNSAKYAAAWWGVPDPAATPGTISGKVWHDANGNGTREGSETSVPIDLSVYLYRSSGQYVATTRINGPGDYSFTNLPAGEYRVSFLPSVWTEFTAAGQNNSANSQGYTNVVTVGQGGAAVRASCN